MVDPGFQAPRVSISRVYTRTGDAGTTALVGGQRVAKDDPRIEAYGTVDELNSWVGLCRAASLEAANAISGSADLAADVAARNLADLAATLLRVQHQLFNLGSVLATLPQDVGPRQPRVRPQDVEALEAEMDALTGRLDPLRSFVLPGSTRLNGLLHLARTVCRRAERACMPLMRDKGASGYALEAAYLNRLSDALFVWSRWASHLQGVPEVLWDPNRA